MRTRSFSSPNSEVRSHTAPSFRRRDPLPATPRPCSDGPGLVQGTLREPRVEVAPKRSSVAAIRSRMAVVPATADASRSSGPSPAPQARPPGPRRTPRCSRPREPARRACARRSMRRSDPPGRRCRSAGTPGRPRAPRPRAAARASRRTRRPRPPATVSGPVGFAETNSTRTRSACVGTDAPVGIAGREDRRHRLAVPAVRQVEVQKPRPGDLHAHRPHRPAARRRPRQPLGDVARILPDDRRQQHGRVGGVVAHLRARRALERGPLRLAPPSATVADGGIDACAQLCERDLHTAGRV